MHVPHHEHLDPIQLPDNVRVWVSDEEDQASWMVEKADGSVTAERLPEIRRRGLDVTSLEFRQHAQRFYMVWHMRWINRVQDAEFHAGQGASDFDDYSGAYHSALIDLVDALLSDPVPGRG